jgi:hypothetical protein
MEDVRTIHESPFPSVLSLRFLFLSFPDPCSYFLFPHRFFRCFPSGDPPESQAFSNISRSLVKQSEKGTQLPCAVEAEDGATIWIKNLSLHVSSGSPLGVEETGPEFHCIVWARSKGGKFILGAVKYRVFTKLTAPVILRDRLL